MEEGAIAQEDNWPSPVRAWAFVALLVAAYALAFVDRQILSLMIAPIKRDLAITDTQFSLLTGLAFTVFYTLLGVPLAWLADRRSRRALITASIGFWSLMTAACGLAGTFLTLFLARIGVGIGEAGLSPAAYSAIADTFPPHKRARALGVYTLGATMGVGIAFMVGGLVVQWASTAPPVMLPRFGVVQSWQLSLFIVSLPGPVLMLLMLATREPRRRGVRVELAGIPFIRYIRRIWRTYALLATGHSLIGVSIAAYLTWAPAFLQRAYSWPISRIGLMLGAIMLVCSTAGVLVGASYTDRQTRSGRRDGVVRTGIAGAVLALPLAVLAPFAPSGEVSGAVIAMLFFAFGLTQGLPPAKFQAIVPGHLRARSIAIYLLIGNLIALTAGPTIVAIISDHWLRDPTRIGVAIAIVSGVALPSGILCLIVARTGFVAAATLVAEEQPT